MIMFSDNLMILYICKNEQILLGRGDDLVMNNFQLSTILCLGILKYFIQEVKSCCAGPTSVSFCEFQNYPLVTVDFY